MSNPWIWRPKPPLGVRLRLICIPHAGGTAGVFKLWADALPDWIDLLAVQLLGRQQRAEEIMPTRMGVLVRELESGLRDELDIPYAIFGSCTGSIIAYELTQLIHKRDLPLPSRLFVASCRAPHLPDRDEPIHKLDDDSLRNELSRLGGTAGSLLQHPEMMRVFGPILRRDFELAETYLYRTRPVLDLPMTVFGGNRDEIVTHEEREAWHEHTSAQFNHQLIDGGHYLVEDAVDALCAAISQQCTEAVCE